MFFIIIFFYSYITLWGEKGSGLSEIFFSGITHFFKKPRVNSGSTPLELRMYEKKITK